MVITGIEYALMGAWALQTLSAAVSAMPKPAGPGSASITASINGTSVSLFNQSSVYQSNGIETLSASIPAGTNLTSVTVVASATVAASQASTSSPSDYISQDTDISIYSIYIQA